MEEQRDLKNEQCTNPRCLEKLPLVANLDYPAETWWLKCKKCFTFVRSDFKYCELCGLDLASTIKEARLKKTSYLQDEKRKKDERRAIKEETEKLAAQKREFEELRQLWEKEKNDLMKQLLVDEEEEDDNSNNTDGMDTSKD